jgi:hypothetical protein
MKRVETLLAELASDKAPVKFGAAKNLRVLSETRPELLYPHFDTWAALLGHENAILRWNAILLLGNLAPVDSERRLDGLLDRYLAPICGPQLIDAANTIRGATAMALGKPALAGKIAARILAVEQAVYATPECRNLAIGHAIECLGRLMPLNIEKSAIQAFVCRQAENPRPATRNKAAKFLRKWREDAA